LTSSGGNLARPSNLGGTSGQIGLGLTVAGVPNLEEELTIDKSTMETMKALYAAKERAVQNEDFDEAKRIKETIERLKTNQWKHCTVGRRKKIWQLRMKIMMLQKSLRLRLRI